MGRSDPLSRRGTDGGGAQNSVKQIEKRKLEFRPFELHEALSTTSLERGAAWVPCRHGLERGCGREWTRWPVADLAGHFPQDFTQTLTTVLCTVPSAWRAADS